jgi:oxygen-independent coproporphyrinogen-3 oxidase
LTARAPVALYVHFPFCLSVCPYCDFVVVAGRATRGPGNRIAAFVDALEQEIVLRAPLAPTPLASVYFGGGTPSLMSPAQVEQLLTAAERAFGISNGAEITLEANPGPADRGDLAGFRAAGVNRLSIGAQSMVGAELKSLGRRHTPADVGDCVSAARRGGFANISLDLLYDVPGQTTDSWRHSLADALALAPDHLSAYALTLDADHADADVLPISRGAARWRERVRVEQDEDRTAEMYVVADELLGSAGFEWYEISNWARRGFESRHNLAYWTSVAWAAVGPGAHAFDGVLTRRWNAARLDGYLAALTAGRLPPGGVEHLDPATAQAERIVLCLRTAAGVPAGDIPVDALGWGRSYGLVEAVEGHVRLTIKGRLLSNELFARLLPRQMAVA